MKQIKTSHLETPAVNIRQLKYESDTWKRLLTFVQEENIHLKNHFSEILRDDFDTSNLAQAENFQTSFVRQDECIAELKKMIIAFDKLLNREVFLDGLNSKQITAAAKRIRERIKQMSKTFDRLKSDFSHFSEAF
jgi:hypothetical protein